MKLYEFEGSELFRQEGIPVPNYAVVSSPQEARDKARAVGLPVIIKAQVLTGGRWLAGGIQTAESLDEVETVAQRILGSSIGGLPVHRVMVAEKVETAREFYLGVTVDEYNGTPVAILSADGGVYINEVGRDHPESVVSRNIPITTGLSPSEAKQMAREAGLSDQELVEVAGALRALYSVFRKYDTLLAEINPLVRTTRGTYLALDAKVEIDDSSLYRHPDLNLVIEERITNPLELKGRQIGVTYVELDGDIAVIASGAGLGLASIDIIGETMRPANFLETGGAITADLLYNVMDLILQKPGIRAVFINLYGGINPIHEGARGVARYMQEHNVTIPIVAKALGNRQEETWEIFREQGVRVVTDVSTEKAVAELARVLEAGN
ncbi:Succinate--CoA ligase [GDP-forming] subunit beta [subsurface metagenome]